MKALAEEGIDLVLEGTGAIPEEKTAEDIKAEGIIKWLYQQRDDRNAIYYFNELARRYLEHRRLRLVEALFVEFTAWDTYDAYVNPNNNEIEAYKEERTKIKRLVMLIKGAKEMGLGFENMKFSKNLEVS
jgi:hypothetical protein